VVVVVAVGIISGAVGNYYAENVTGLMWVLGASLMLGNVKVLPSFLMEKEMKYAKVVWIEIAEVLATQGMNLIGAGIGWGVMSFAWGVVVGKLVGIVVAVGVSGWKIWGVTRVWTGVKHNFRFALNLQLNNAVGYLGGALVPVVVGKVVGLETVGLLGWAGGIAMGLRMFSEATARVVFPATAKVAHDSSRTKKLIKRSLLASIVLSWPLILGFGLFARPVIQWLFLPEWWKGMGVLYAALVYSLVAVIESVLTRVSLGLGWADLVRNASLWSGFITWIVAIVMLYHVGIVGVVLGQICGSLVSTLVLANRLTKLDLK
jgi:PST family polysaccharide transporter